ncbi:MAG TPA: response regulator transcription factor [Acidimicrobiales bacterium]|nr:response regulator transcription factor [Acidimicrobiales bacterium]
MSGAEDRTVLVVDDDDQVRGLLQLVLEAEGYTVALAADLSTAMRRVGDSPVDLVVLDVAVGEEDGRTLLSKLRTDGDLPVVLISGKGDATDRVIGLRLGADDFLSKPFSPAELVARVESVLRRSRPRDTPAAPHEPTLHVDERGRRALLDGRPVELTAREFDLLAFLARSPGTVHTRADLLRKVWRSSPDWQDEATVAEHVRRLRRKLEADPDHPRWITTAQGTGYRFEP